MTIEEIRKNAPPNAVAYISIKVVYTGYVCNIKLSKEHIDNAIWIKTPLKQNPH